MPSFKCENCQTFWEPHEMTKGDEYITSYLSHWPATVHPSSGVWIIQGASCVLHLYPSLFPSSVFPSVLFLHLFPMLLTHLHCSSLVSMRFIRLNKSFLIHYRALTALSSCRFMAPLYLTDRLI